MGGAEGASEFGGEEGGGEEGEIRGRFAEGPVGETLGRPVRSGAHRALAADSVVDMSDDDERYVKGSLCSPFAGGPYAYLDPNRAGPLHAYALGYLEAAITLGESAMRRPSDLAFYPLLHLFRHGVELALKQLAYDVAKYKGASEGPKLNHLIEGLWDQLRPGLDEWIRIATLQR